MSLVNSMRDNYKKRELFSGLILFIGDIVFISLAFYLSYVLRFKIDSTQIFIENIKYYLIYSIAGLVIIIILFYFRRLYSYRNLYSGIGNNEGIIISVIITIFLLMIFNYYFHRNTYQLSRIWIVYATVFSIIILIIGRALLRKLILWFFKKKNIYVNILIVGINEEGNRIAKTFGKNGIEKIDVVGFIDKEDKISKISESNDYKDIKILGSLDKLGTIIEKFNVNRIIISSSDFKYFDILKLLEKVENQNIEVQMSPSLFEFSVSRMRILEYMGIPLIQIQKTAIKGINKLLKFLIDYSFGIVLFIIFMLAYPFVGILIKIDSKGPILYSQERYGRNFKKIRIYKFRTMRTGADKEKEYLKKIYNREGEFKLVDDPRITKVGKFLRKTSIDELPQVINLLKGDLSLIGPRALAIEEGDLLKEWEKKRMQANQGITGLWQVSGRSEVSYEERMKLDLYYIQNWSIWLELKIIILTMMKVFKGNGAY